MTETELEEFEAFTKNAYQYNEYELLSLDSQSSEIFDVLSKEDFARFCSRPSYREELGWTSYCDGYSRPGLESVWYIYWYEEIYFYFDLADPGVGGCIGTVFTVGMDNYLSLLQFLEPHFKFCEDYRRLVAESLEE